MFTTIQNLRASNAMQDRVTKVENWMKRNNPEYTPDGKFPIFLIASSNPVEDVDWVYYNKSTHAAWPEVEKAVLMQFAVNGNAPAAQHHFEEVVRQLRRNKAQTIEEMQKKYKEAYDSVFGTNAVLESASPELNASTANEVITAADTTQVADVAAETKVKTETAAETTSEFSKAIQGLFHIAVGNIMIAKDKTFEEALKYATSPTGNRIYSQYAEEQSNVEDAKSARAYLKNYISKL